MSKIFNFISGSLITCVLVSACIPFGGIGSGGGSLPTPTPTSTVSPSPTPIVGWNPTQSPPVVTGRANSVGFTSDQVGNLYLSYQGIGSLSVYRYGFNQVNPQWQLIAESLNMSLSSYTSSIVITPIGDINLMYLYNTDITTTPVIHYLTALPDKNMFKNILIPRVSQTYTYSGTAAQTPACPAPISHEIEASDASMTTDNTNKQIIAFSDETFYESAAVNVESGVCRAPKYNGGSRLGIYFASDYTTYRQLSDGSVAQVQIVATPNGTSNNLPAFVAYQDGANAGGISVQEIIYNPSSESYEFYYLGGKNFSNGSANYISIAADKNAVPYVAYENSNQLLTVLKYEDTTNTWKPLNSQKITNNITTWISLTIDPKTNLPLVAYQEESLIKVKRYDGESWNIVGSPLPSFTNNYAAYTNLIMRQNNIDSWQPAIVYQATPANVDSSALSIYYYYK